MAPGDHDLWERISHGDVRAFDAFYQECAPRMLNFLRHLMGSKQAAEDVTQDTFLQLWRRPNGFQPEKGSLRAYLFGVARRRGAEWHRHNPVAAEAASDEQVGASAEASSVMSDALARLDPERRALLWLREVEGQSYDELAETLDIPVGTVKSRLFAAREELRGIWISKREQNKKGAKA